MAGEPVSSPRNSPICHWRVSIHNASRASALSSRMKSAVRGRPSSLFQSMTVGKARESSASLMSSMTNLSTIVMPVQKLMEIVIGGVAQVDRDREERGCGAGRRKELGVGRGLNVDGLDGPPFRHIERLVQSRYQIDPIPRARKIG